MVGVKMTAAPHANEDHEAGQSTQSLRFLIRINSEDEKPQKAFTSLKHCGIKTCAAKKAARGGVRKSRAARTEFRMRPSRACEHQELLRTITDGKS
jgi:hypothetical protein